MPESLTASWFSALTRAREGSCEKLGASKGTDAVPFLVEAPSHLKSVPHGNGERCGERSLQGIRNFFTASAVGGLRSLHWSMRSIDPLSPLSQLQTRGLAKRLLHERNERIDKVAIVNVKLHLHGARPGHC